jgi:MFS family permease
VRGSRVADLRSTIGAIMARPNAALGLATIVLSQAAMVAVMTMTPLHMRDHGHAGLSGYVIGLHIAGMYGAAPLVGRYSDRVGRMRSIQIGGAILASGTIAAVVAGYQPVLIFVGLFLLGLGWNFGLIAGSALLNESVPEGIRVKAQGAADVMLSVFGATAAISSGLIKQGAGFHWLANLATGMAVFVLLWALSASRRQAVTTEPV